MRPAIVLLLLTALAIGGCDRQTNAPGQATGANTAETAAASEPAEAAGNETVVEEEIGKLNRAHKGEAAFITPFENPAGQKVTIADFKGKPLLLNLWATWCIPCVKEMPTLDALAASLGDSVQVVAVSQDSKGDAVVAPFFQKAGFKKLQPYLDTDSALSVGLGVNLPTTILFDSQGKEVWRMEGGMDWTGETAKELIAEAK
ncbi:TlpA disulfide reductase family protein [Sphingomonas sp.]|uniref:TlpA family protein disulfide reductase n=1 Tax=Sphingomonas sp. TaxID=28214 RepID=UPI0034513FB4